MATGDQRRGRKPVSARDDAEQALLAKCRYYVDHADHADVLALSEDGEISRGFVLGLMRLAIARVRRKDPSAKRVVDLVDQFYTKGTSLGVVYQQVADLTGKSPEAVRKAHERERPGVFR